MKIRIADTENKLKTNTRLFASIDLLPFINISINRSQLKNYFYSHYLTVGWLYWGCSINFFNSNV